MRSINSFFDGLEHKPVIAALRKPTDLPTALRARVESVFFLSGTIFELQVVVDAIANEQATHRTVVFCHIDLLQGIGRDAAGMRFLAEHIGVDGILTTRSHLIQAAKQAGLFTIQRLFLLDSSALQTAVNVLSKSKPDAVEILPALVLPTIWRRLPVDELPPIIAGGLVETEDELREVLRAPVKAVSTSRPSLWSFRKT